MDPVLVMRPGFFMKISYSCWQLLEVLSVRKAYLSPTNKKNYKNINNLNLTSDQM